LLDFANWLSENDMPIKLHSSTTRGHNARYKNEWICYILIYGANEMKTDYAYWSVAPCLNHTERYESELIDNEIKDIIWDGVRFCTRCLNSAGKFPPRDCAGGITVTVLEKEIEGVCAHKLPLPCFRNPDKATIDKVKKLLKIEKKARDDRFI
jgi:hypothetical protein